jgi:hypothetical protein
MFKVMFFLWRREGMTTEEFQRYYEERHAHHNQRVRPASADYRRNYPVMDDPWTDIGGLSKLGNFDVVTENWYPNRGSFENVLDIMVRSPAAKSVVEDELRFEQRERKTVVVTDEVPTLDYYGAADYEESAKRNDRATFKLMRFVWLKNGADARSKYAAIRGDTVDAAFAGSLDRRRNYLCYDDPISFTGPQEEPRKVDRNHLRCDIVEEFWYSDRASAVADEAAIQRLKLDLRSTEVEEDATLAVVREFRMPRPARIP